jgi:hypothetical protein
VESAEGRAPGNGATAAGNSYGRAGGRLTRTFLFGPGFMSCINAVLLGTLMYKSRLVPRHIPTMGLIGAPLLIAANIATLFGHNEQTSGITMLATLPIAFWELSVGTWMTVKGFKASPITANITKID